MLTMPNTDEPRRGRPPTGRKVVLQAGFDAPDAGQIERLAERDGVAVSAMLRDLALEGLAARLKKKGRL
jgi:predicted kinase